MAQVKDLIVSGVMRCVGRLYAPDIVGTTTNAVADNLDQIIDSTYIKNVSTSNGVTITLTKGDGTTSTFNVRGTEYSNLPASSGGTDVSLVTTGDKYNWNNKTSNTGTVTQVTAGVGLTGKVTTSGTIKAKLKSETLSTLASASPSSTANRQYPVVPDSDGYLSVNVPWSGTGVTSTTELGFGYAVCSTAESTTAKTANIPLYALGIGGIVSIKFTNAVPANSTLNITSKGDKPIFYSGAAIPANVISAGDTVTMMYDGTNYNIISLLPGTANRFDCGEETASSV